LGTACDGGGERSKGAAREEKKGAERKEKAAYLRF
jgi:hypothetical protein